MKFVKVGGNKTLIRWAMVAIFLTTIYTAYLTTLNMKSIKTIGKIYKMLKNQG